MSSTTSIEMDENNLTDYQKSIHNSQNPDVVMESYYGGTPCVTPFNTKDIKRMEAVADGIFVRYKCNENFGFIRKSTLFTTIPSMKVKDEHSDEVRISWPPRIGHQIVVDAEFQDKNLGRYQSFNRIWLEMYSMYFQPKGEGKGELYKKAVGDLPCMCEWSTSLPSKNICFKQPWFYSVSGETEAHPLFFMKRDYSHKYKFQLKVVDLLRVQRKDGNEWKTVPKSEIFNYIEGPSEIPQPDLYGTYRTITKEEQNIIKFDCEDDEDEEEKVVHTRYIPDIVSFDKFQFTPKVSGGSLDTNLSVTLPTHALFWVCERSGELGNYTNEFGENPLQESNIVYSSESKFDKEIPIEMFSIDEGMENTFASAPNVEGFNVYSQASRVFTFDQDPGISFGGLNAKLTSQFKPTNETYNIAVRALVYRRFTITKKGGSYTYKFEGK